MAKLGAGSRVPSSGQTPVRNAGTLARGAVPVRTAKPFAGANQAGHIGNILSNKGTGMGQKAGVTVPKAKRASGRATPRMK